MRDVSDVVSDDFFITRSTQKPAPENRVFLANRRDEKVQETIKITLTSTVKKIILTFDRSVSLINFNRQKLD